MNWRTASIALGGTAAFFVLTAAFPDLMTLVTAAAMLFLAWVAES